MNILTTPRTDISLYLHIFLATCSHCLIFMLRCFVSTQSSLTSNTLSENLHWFNYQTCAISTFWKRSTNHTALHILSRGTQHTSVLLYYLRTCWKESNKPKALVNILTIWGGNKSRTRVVKTYISKINVLKCVLLRHNETSFFLHLWLCQGKVSTFMSCVRFK